MSTEHFLAHSTPIDKLLTFITGRGHPTDVQVVANSPEIHQLIIADPIVFTSFFSRDAIKAIIYQGCIFGNLNLVRCLIESIQLDVVNEKVANPFGRFSVQTNGNSEFLDQLPAIQAAAQSSSLALMQYLVSFYDKTPLDKISVKGDLQGALAVASGHDSYEIVRFLLDSGINANSEVKAAHTTSALHRAVLTGSMANIELLVKRGAKITDLNQYVAVKSGRLDVVVFFVSQGVSFKEGASDMRLSTAFESFSVPMVRYFLNTLKFNLYEMHDATSTDKRDWEIGIVKKVLRGGSVEMLRFLERELHIPVGLFLEEERDSTKSFHHLHGRTLLFEAVSSYNVGLLRFLFETKGFFPKPYQMAQLLSYAFDSSSPALLSKKFLTHAYLLSFLHEDQYLRKLLRDVSDIGNLQFLSVEELFVLYAEYTKNFSEIPTRLEYGNKFCDNAIHLANEISRRNLNADELLSVAQQNNANLLPAVRFFLTVTGTAYSNAALKGVLERSVVGRKAQLSSDPHLSFGEPEFIQPLNLAFDTKRPRIGFFESRDARHLNKSRDCVVEQNKPSL